MNTNGLSLLDIHRCCTPWVLWGQGRQFEVLYFDERTWPLAKDIQVVVAPHAPTLHLIVASTAAWAALCAQFPELSERDVAVMLAWHAAPHAEPGD